MRTASTSRCRVTPGSPYATLAEAEGRTLEEEVEALYAGEPGVTLHRLNLPEHMHRTINIAMAASMMTVVVLAILLQ